MGRFIISGVFLILPGILLMGGFISCIGSSPALISETPPSLERIVPRDPSPERIIPGDPPPERIVPGDPPPVPPEQNPVIEGIIQRVKQNSPGIPKYFILEEDAHIIVKADLRETIEGTGTIKHFEVVYDLKEDPPGDSRFTIPFFVRDLETGLIRHDRLQWQIREDATGILLSFDDDYQEVWEQYLDMFEQYGAKVTFFVKGDPCPFCQKALHRGHDVGYHTIHHLNLPKVSREVFFEETLSALDAFRKKGIPLTSFAYPFGLSEPWMHEELFKSFRILRGYGVSFRVYDREAIQKGYISSKAIDNIIYKQDEDFDAMIRIMLRTLKFIGGDRILPLTTHTISDTADWGIKPRRLEYLLQTAKDLGLRFYRYKDFCEQ